jgi:hypothetical protein
MGKGMVLTHSAGFTLLAGLLLISPALAEQAPNAPLPDIRQLMHEVQQHQKQLEKVRENYTYSSLQTVQDVDSNGKVVKTETKETENFFVNSHLIERIVKKNGKPLTGHDLEKETERVTKLVEKAQSIPPGQPLEGQTITIGRLLEIMDVRNPRRVLYHGRPTIVFDFIGRKDAKTHGIIEDASKKVQGTIWIDEGDRQVAHMEVGFNDNFHVAGGLLANIQKGSNFRFDQSVVSHPDGKDSSPGTLVNEELWLPTGGEGTMQARILLVKNLRQHFIERDYDFKRFSVDSEQQKDAKVVPQK